MPAAGRSFYANEAHGHRYWDYVSEELPRVVGQFFRVSQEPADTFVAGLSMGGYGALKLALTHPERYAAAASCPAPWTWSPSRKQPDRDEVMGRVFDHQVTARATTCSRCSPQRSEVPPLHVSCGTEDWLLRRPTVCRRRDGRRADVTTDFRPGDHVWSLWDAVIQDVIAWLPVRFGQVEQ